MPDSDLNDKFKEYYAENGVDAEQVAAFDMNNLDYVHWGHHAVAFPSFFEVTELDSLEAWVYSGYHGTDGVRIVKHNLQVGQPDPRCNDYIITRILSATDMNDIPTILIDTKLIGEQDSIVTKLPIWIYAAEEPVYLEGALVNTFGSGKITVNCHESETVDQDYNFTVFSTEEE